MAVTLGEALVAITGNRDKYKRELEEGKKDAHRFGLDVGNILETAVGFGLGKVGLTIVTKLGNAFKEALTVLPRMAYDVASQAAPLQGIVEGFAISAEKAGTDYETFLARLTVASKGLVSQIDLMRAANEALTGATGEFAREFGEALPTLLEAAQVAARRTGKDVTFLFDSLVSGVKRSSPLLIDNTGIVLKLGAANDAMAASLGKTVEELTEQEKQVALLRATQEAAQALIAESGDTAETAADKLGRYRVRLIDVKDAIGLSLQPALGRLMDGLTTLADRVLPEVEAAFEKIGGAILSLGGQLAEEFASLIAPAQGWGEGVGIAFANGLARVAPYVIGAVQAIADIITEWMQPGSPPRMLPELDQWGAGAMQEYLAGFGKADFSVLRDFSRTVEEMLRIEVSAGRMAEGDLVPALVGSRAGIADALAELRETGEVSEEVYGRIREGAGAAGEEVERFARLYIDSQRVEAAEAERSEIASDYARRLAEAKKRGASKSEIDAIKAERKEALQTASDRIKAAREVDDQATRELELEKLRLEALSDERRLYDEQARTLGGLIASVGNLSGAKSALKDVTDRAAEAEWNYRFAIADTEGKLELLRQKLAETEEGSEDYWRTKQQIALWEERARLEMEKSTGAAGAAKAAWDELTDSMRETGYVYDEVTGKLSRRGEDTSMVPPQILRGEEGILPEPENFWATFFDMDEIRRQADEVRQAIKDALMPEGEGGTANWAGLGTRIGEALVGTLGEAVRAQASAALFGGEKDATWSDIGLGLGELLGAGIVDGIKTALGAINWLDVIWDIITGTAKGYGTGMEGLARGARGKILPEVEFPEEKDTPFVLGTLEGLWNSAVNAYREWQNAGEVLDQYYEDLKSTSEEADRTVSDLTTNTETNMEAMSTGVAAHTAVIRDDWAAKWREVEEDHEVTWADILEAASSGGILLGADILSNIGNILALLQGKRPEWQAEGRGMMDGLLTGIEEKTENVYDAILKPIRDAIEEIKRLIEQFRGLSIPTSEGDGGDGGDGGETPPSYASGTTYHPGGLAYVHANELIQLPQGSQVFPAAQTQAMLQPAPVVVNIGPVTVREDEDIQELAWRVAKEIERRR
ncbi:MAG: hypothetical protein PHQ60_15725 [Sideroxydans sp.]|nr:hypothetical protein [Sideroxydans sp.]